MMEKSRIAVLIGRNGKTKKIIEELTKTKIEIDSESGDYNVKYNNENSESQKIDDNTLEEFNEILEELELDDLSLENLSFEPNFSIWLANTIIDAINIGFKPEKALKLIDDEYSFVKILLENIIGTSDKKLKRMVGRLIGERGKMRSAIEHFSGAHISIFPEKKVIGLIGDFSSLKIARKAVSMILEGLPHKVTLIYLQKKFQERKEEEFQQNWKPSFT